MEFPNLLRNLEESIMPLAEEYLGYKVQNENESEEKQM
jgi:hypothetical protein